MTRTRTSVSLLLLAASVACQGLSNDSKVVAEPDIPMTQPTVAKAIPPRPADSAASLDNVVSAVQVEHVGLCRAAPELRSALSRAAEMADLNGDGTISKDEANGALNFMIGGLFFRADENTDGKLSRSELDNANKELQKSYPSAAAALRSALSLDGVSDLVGAVERDLPQELTLADTRNAATKLVDAVFRAVDRNGDQRITRLEADQGVDVGFASVGRLAFRQADTDGDKTLTLAEFRSIVEKPVDHAFATADSNGDGKLSEAEAGSIMAWVSERLDAIGESSVGTVAEVLRFNVR